MTIRSSFLVAAVFVVAMAAIPVAAHHSFAAQFDRSKPITLTGPVTKVEWINPHGRLFIDAKDANGQIVNWEIELGASAILTRNGWKKTDVQIGGTVTVTGFMSKDGSNVANATTVTLANGKKVFAGSSADVPANR